MPRRAEVPRLVEKTEAVQDNDFDGTTDEGFDTDGDEVADCLDNCPSLANPTQEDCDGDGIGDACALDHDGNGIAATPEPASTESGLRSSSANGCVGTAVLFGKPFEKGHHYLGALIRTLPRVVWG